MGRVSTAEQAEGRGQARRVGCTGRCVSGRSPSSVGGQELCTSRFFFFFNTIVDVQRKRVVTRAVASQSGILIKGIRKRSDHQVYEVSLAFKTMQTLHCFVGPAATPGRDGQSGCEGLGHPESRCDLIFHIVPESVFPKAAKALGDVLLSDGSRVFPCALQSPGMFSFGEK